MYAFVDRTTKFFRSKNGTFVILLVIYIFAVIITLSSNVKNVFGPIHFDDELIYWDTAYSIHTGTFNAVEHHQYPPLYPISLLPAFTLFSSGNVYNVAKMLNILYITSIVFPIYSISKRLMNKRLSFLVCLLVLLLPTQMVIPRSMISENVFYPLFFWSLYFACFDVIPAGHRLHILQGVLLGILSGLLVLTRYIGLSIVPVLWIIWWIKPFSGAKPPFLISTKKILHAISIVIPFLLLVGLWVYIGCKDGVRALDMLGFFLTPNASQLSSRGLLLWIIIYLSFSILIAAPYLGLMIMSTTLLRPKRWQIPLSRWILSVILICIFFLIPVIRHSFRAGYNFPVPLKMQGRYILYFAPLFIITILSFINSKQSVRFKSATFWLIIIIPLTVIPLAYIILFKGFIFLDQPLLSSYNSPDGYLFQALGVFYPIAGVVISILYVILTGKNRRAPILLLTTVLALIYFQGTKMVLDQILLPMQRNGSQAYHLIQEIDRNYSDQSQVRDQVITLIVPADSSPTSLKKWDGTFTFYGFNQLNITQRDSNEKESRMLLEAVVMDDHFVLSKIPKKEFNAELPSHFKFLSTMYAIRNIQD